VPEIPDNPREQLPFSSVPSAPDAV
jgi:hypothetical protein